MKKVLVLSISAVALSTLGGCWGNTREDCSFCDLWFNTPGYCCCRARNMHYCTPSDPAGIVVPRPPAPLAESIPTAPSEDFVWVGGFWDWTGSDFQWVYGRWTLPPGATVQVWVPPRYDYRVDRYFYYRGYWQRNSNY